MKGCANCARLEALNAELEQALEGAVFTAQDERARLTFALSVTPQEAVILGVLARAESATCDDLNQACAAQRPRGSRDRNSSEELVKSYARVMVANIRRRFGQDAVTSRPWAGYRLSDQMRARVLEVIGEQP